SPRSSEAMQEQGARHKSPARRAIGFYWLQSEDLHGHSPENAGANPRVRLGIRLSRPDQRELEEVNRGAVVGIHPGPPILSPSADLNRNIDKRRPSDSPAFGF